MRWAKINLLGVVSVVLAGCAASTDLSEPRVSEPREVSFDAIDPPLSLAIVSVEDKTGSTRPSGDQNFADPSRAVSQGAVEILKHLLTHEPFRSSFNQFERENLNALLTERRVAEQFNQTLKSEAGVPVDGTVLRSLLSENVDGLIELDDLRPVDYLLAGAVVGYDPNIVDDGVGFMVNGFGFTRRNRTDRISVVLYVTDVNSGQIIASSHQKAIVGSSLEKLSAVGYPVADILLEFEGGQAQNAAVTDELFAAFYLALVDLTVSLGELKT